MDFEIYRGDSPGLKRSHQASVFALVPVCKNNTGIASVRLVDDTIRLAEMHWYEAHGVGKREYKLKLPFLDYR